MGTTLLGEIKTGYNSTYPKGGVSCLEETFVQAEISVIAYLPAGGE
jgi:hypothetical protein